MGVAAVNITAGDLGLSVTEFEKLIADFELTFISANIVDEETGEPYFTSYAEIQVNELDVAVVGVTNISLHAWELSDGRRLVTADPFEKANWVIEEIRENYDLVFLLAHIPKWKLSKFADSLPPVDLILAGDGAYRTAEPLQIGSCSVFYPGRQGEYLGLIELSKDDEGSWATAEHQLVRMELDLPEDPEIKAMVDVANNKIKKVSVQ